MKVVSAFQPHVELGPMRGAKDNIEANSVHGSDAAEMAADENRFFFSDLEILG